MPRTDPLPSPPLSSPTSRRAHIVCIDDEEGILNALRQQLEGFAGEYDIDLGRSGEEALDLLGELELEGEEVAMVIADEIMPGMAGVELLEAIHRRSPETIKILLTGQASLQAIVYGINQAGLNQYISKPWDEHVLVLTVGNLLGKFKLTQENKRLLEDLRQSNEKLLEFNRELEARVRERTAALAEANRRLEQLAITDGLTGLYNHRYFHEQLGKQVERSHRNGLPLSLVMIDVDHFKQYNDRNGHPEGDVVLRTLARLLASGRRLNDLVARYGGEEFVVLLPDTHRPAAVRLAEQIRVLVENEPFEGDEHQPGGKLTISLGVATCPDDATTALPLVAASDRALYQAKNAGRNQVQPALLPDPSPATAP